MSTLFMKKRTQFCNKKSKRLFPLKEGGSSFQYIRKKKFTNKCFYCRKLGHNVKDCKVRRVAKSSNKRKTSIITKRGGSKTTCRCTNNERRKSHMVCRHWSHITHLLWKKFLHKLREMWKLVWVLFLGDNTTNGILGQKEIIVMGLWGDMRDL
jgi:hypothetical protein